MKYKYKRVGSSWCGHFTSATGPHDGRPVYIRVRLPAKGKAGEKGGKRK